MSRVSVYIGEAALGRETGRPKRTSALASDVGEAEVLAAGLAAGIVDFKICAVDATWSGLAFARRKA